MTNYYGNTVSVIDTATNLTVATILVGNSPTGIGVTPDGKRVYVLNTSGRSCGYYAPGGCGSVSVIDTKTNAIIPVIDSITHLPALGIPVGDRMYALAVAADGSAVYLSGRHGNIEIATKTNAVVPLFSAGIELDLAVGPDGKIWEPSSFGGPSTSVYDPKTKTSKGLNIASNEVAVSPTGSQAYLSIYNYNGQWAPPLIAAFDAKTYVMRATIPLGNVQAIGEIAFRPDGKFAYVVSTLTDGQSEYVNIINTAAQKVVGTYQAGACPCAGIVVIKISHGDREGENELAASE